MTIASLLIASIALAENAPALLAVAGRAYRYERIRTVTTIFCADDESPDCALIERMQLQPVVDWERLLEKAKRSDPPKKAAPTPLFKETVIDQHGGPWVLSVSRAKKGKPASLGGSYIAEISPDFPGYKVDAGSAGEPGSAEVLRNLEQWSEAAQELGLDANGKPKKKRFGF